MSVTASRSDLRILKLHPQTVFQIRLAVTASRSDLRILKFPGLTWTVGGANVTASRSDLRILKYPGQCRQAGAGCGYSQSIRSEDTEMAQARAERGQARLVTASRSDLRILKFVQEQGPAVGEVVLQPVDPI